jgi:hypothetical protein
MNAFLSLSKTLAPMKKCFLAKLFFFLVTKQFKNKADNVSYFHSLISFIVSTQNPYTHSSPSLFLNTQKELGSAAVCNERPGPKIVHMCTQQNIAMVMFRYSDEGAGLINVYISAAWEFQCACIMIKSLGSNICSRQLGVKLKRRVLFKCKLHNMAGDVSYLLFRIMMR